MLLSQAWSDPSGLLLLATATEVAMDLLCAVIVSLLPASRTRVAATFKEHRHLPPADALRAVASACGLSAADAAAMMSERRTMAEGALELSQKSGVEPIPWFDDRYPALLDCITDPPPVLWVRGEAAALTKPAVAVIGSRAATPYALQVAERLAVELASCGIVVVSGLARGVDSAGHRGCLSAGGRTVAVLGSGLNRVYPAEHRTLATTISAAGAVVSELAPDAAARPEHFPMRNRVISGISLAVVVVEASEKSGSLITARCALEQGRDVMAVPGNVLTGRNRGSHALLKDGAKVVESADDILEGLGWPTGGAAYSNGKLLDSDPLLAHMEAGEVYRLDDLVALTGMSGPKLLPRLLELELGGRVVTSATGGFARVK